MLVDDLHLLELFELLAVGRLEFGAGHALVGVLDVLGAHLTVAVRPHDAGAQPELGVEGIDLLYVLGRVVGPGPHVAGLVEDEVVEHRLADIEIGRGDPPGGVQRLDVGPRADADHFVAVRVDEAGYGKGGRTHHRRALEKLAAGRMESLHVGLLLASRSLGGKCAPVRREAPARILHHSGDASSDNARFGSYPNTSRKANFEGAASGRRSDENDHVRSQDLPVGGSRSGPVAGERRDSRALEAAEI